MSEGIKVVAQRVDPAATITKYARGYETTIINVLENGTERKRLISAGRKRDLEARLKKLPIENVRGMTVSDGSYTMELFAYNGI